MQKYCVNNFFLIILTHVFRILKQVPRQSQQGREIRLNSEYKKDSWGFIANEQAAAVASGWRIMNRRHQG